jgi:hypothetical protein
LRASYRGLGRSLGQGIHIVDELVKRKIRFTAIKENTHFEGKQDLQTKVMVALFGLFAEVERDLISERTRKGLASDRAKGRLLGRPKGMLGKSRLDGKEEEIRLLLQKQVSKASIAKISASRGLPLTALSRQGGYAHILKGYFYTNLVGTHASPLLKHRRKGGEPKAAALRSELLRNVSLSFGGRRMNFPLTGKASRSALYPLPLLVVSGPGRTDLGEV